MIYFSDCILTHQCQKRQGFATYLQYKLTQLWPNLYGLSLVTLGQTSSIISQNIWFPIHHIHGMVNTPSCSHLKKIVYYGQKTCYFSIDSFPFQECSIDRILYIHDQKMTALQFNLLLRSCWKSLNDNGKVILLLPNKLGWWSILNNISFRYKNAFFIQKLNTIFSEHMFRISHYERILYFPPQIMNPLSLRTNKILEFIGLFFVPFLGGYHLIEIEKNLYAPITMTPMKKNYILQENLSKSRLNLKNSE